MNDRTADRALVDRLIDNDDSAWSFVSRELVCPLVKADVKGIRSQCERAGITAPADAIMSRLFANLSKNGHAPLRAFRFECAFRSWIYWHVWDAAQGAIREISEKVDVEVSDDGEFPTLTDTKTPAPDRAMVEREMRDGLNGMLAELWKDNPTRALVLLLRGDLGLSSKEVGVFLNKEPSNVDQIFHRAQASMRKMRDESDARRKPLP